MASHLGTCLLVFSLVAYSTSLLGECDHQLTDGTCSGTPSLVPSQTSRMHFVYLCQSNEVDVVPNYSDNRVCMETLHSIFSLTLFLDPQHQALVHVLANDKCRSCISEERKLGNFGSLADNVEVLLHDLYDVVDSAKAWLHDKAAEATDTFFRNFKSAAAAKIIFPIADKFNYLQNVIVLDADTFFCEDPASLWKLFSDFSGEHRAGLAREQDIRYERGWYTKGCLAGQPGYEPCPPFPAPSGLNSGVVLLRLDRLREDNFSQTAAEIVANRSKNLKLADQDVWNVYGHDYPERVFDIPCEWNVRTDSLCKRRKYTALLHGSRWTLHHKSRAFAKAWMRLGQDKSSPKSLWSNLHRKVQKHCRQEDPAMEPWP